MVVIVLPFAVFFRVLITWLSNRAGASVLLAAVLHASFNTASGPTFLPRFVPERAAALLPLAAVVVLALLAAVATKGRLAQGPRQGAVDARAGNVEAGRGPDPGAGRIAGKAS